MTIADWRREKGLTVTALAEMLGVSHSTVIRWEDGSIRMPAERAVQISELTGIPCHELRPDLWQDAA